MYWARYRVFLWPRIRRIAGASGARPASNSELSRGPIFADLEAIICVQAAINPQVGQSPRPGVAISVGARTRNAPMRIHEIQRPVPVEPMHPVQTVAGIKGELGRQIPAHQAVLIETARAV